MDSDRSLSRRALILAAFGGTAAVAARAVGAPDLARAASNVQLGASNFSSQSTSIQNTSTSSSAKAFVGRARGAAINGTNSLSANSGSLGTASTAVLGVAASANGNGVFGSANNGAAAYGVWGTSSSGSGVVGDGKTWGVRGAGATIGVYGVQPGSGNYGEVGGATSGVNAVAKSSQGNGIRGTANLGAAAFGVWGMSTTGYAGYFSGKVNVTGELTAPSSAFRIDHPDDPENRYLQHSFVGADERLSIYTGNTTTDASGRATVRLPAYAEGLSGDFRYHLTVIGTFAQAIVEQRVRDGRFVIRTSEPGVDVSWQVTGVRRDAFARRNPFRAEPAKRGLERGSLVRPGDLGRPASADFVAARPVARGHAADRLVKPVDHSPRQTDLTDG